MARPWYPRYPDDYARKTADLTFAEHGAYGLLMDQYYRTGEPLPENPRALFRICRGKGRAELQALERVLNRFFVRANGVFRNARADEEITRAQVIHEKRVKGGMCSALARTHAEHKGVVRARTIHPQPQLQEQDSEPRLDSVGSANAKPKRGTRWESTRIVGKDWISDAISARKKLGLPEIDLVLEAEKFADFWASKSGAGATKTNWHRAWMFWAKNAKGNSNGMGPRTGADGGSGALARIAEKARAAREEQERLTDVLET